MSPKSTPRHERSSVEPWLGAALTVLVLGLAVLAVRNWAWRERSFIGSPDEAAYAHQASMIQAGNGLRVNYVQHFFHNHGRLPHPEDHYGPGYGILLAPLMQVARNPEAAGIVPGLVCGSLLLPLLTLGIGRKLGAAPHWAAGAAVWVLLSPQVQQVSARVLADVPFVCLVLAAWAATAWGRAAPWFRALLAGLLLGAAYLLKPAALFAMPGLAVSLLVGLPTQEENSTRQKAKALAWLGVGLAIFALPWMARNVALFDDPIYSANKHIGPGQDYQPEWVSEKLRRVWWARPDEEPPTTPRVAYLYGVERVLDVLGERLNRALLHHELRWPTAVLCMSALLLRRRPSAIPLAGYYLSQAVLLAFLFPVWTRYLLLLWPVSAALAAAAATHVADALAEQDPRPAASERRWVALPAVLLLGVLLAWPGPRALYDEALHYGPTGCAERIHSSQSVTMEAAQWCASNLHAGAVVMTQDCWRFAYYSELPTVNIPSDETWAIDEVIKEYGVTHIVLIRRGTRASYAERAEEYIEGTSLQWLPQEGPEFATIYALSS